MSRAGESVILEEQLDENYEPNNAEILEYAQWLGMEVQREPDLVWIAREGLKAPLPEHWKPCRMPDNGIYYFNFQTGESTWDHPCDEYYRKLYAEEKRKRDHRLARGMPPSNSAAPSSSEPSRRKVLPAVQYPEQFRQSDPDKRRYEGDPRANMQQDLDVHTSRRPSSQSEAASGGHSWPKNQTSLPRKEVILPHYEPYAQRQQSQPRAETFSPNANRGEDETVEWDREAITPSNTFSRQRASPATPPAPNGGAHLNRSLPPQWAQNPQSPTPSSYRLASPPRNNGSVPDWSDSDTTEEEERSASGSRGQSGQRRSSKEPADPDEHILKAQEAAHRREFMQRQRLEREEWEKEARQKERASREEWEKDMLKDRDNWKRQKQEQVMRERHLMEEEYNEHMARLQDDEESNMSQLAAASQDRLAAAEEQHLADLDQLKQERDQLLLRAASENRQLRKASDSGKPLPSNLEEAEVLLRDAREAAEEQKAQLMEEARRAAEEAKRAMLQQARMEVETERQRMMQLLHKEMEQRQGELEPVSPNYSPTDDRSADPNQKVHRWKAIMQEEKMSARQREALAEKVAQTMAGEEARMVDAERRRVQARIEARLAAEERQLVQERLEAIEAQLRRDEEAVYSKKRRELEERINERLRAEEEELAAAKRGELEASLVQAFEKQRGEREISMRFELEKELQAKRKMMKAEMDQKYREENSGSPSGFMANLLPGQQLTEAQTLEKERAQMMERVRIQTAKEEEQLMKEHRESLAEKAKRSPSEEKETSVVEDKRMSEGEERKPYHLDRSLSMEELSEGFMQDKLQGEIDKVEEEGRERLAKVKDEVEKQVREARESALVEWESEAQATFEAEKEKRIAQMRGQMEMLVKSERLQLTRQRQKDLAEAKKKAEEERSLEVTPVSVLPERRQMENELRAKNDHSLEELRKELEGERAQTIAKLKEENERAFEEERERLEKERQARVDEIKSESERELEELREKLATGRTEELSRLEDEKRAELERGAQVERGTIEQEGKEALEAARQELAQQLEELARKKDEELEAARNRVEEESRAEEQRLREAMEEEVAERIKKDKKRRLEEEKKKEAELKKEMKARQEFQRAKMEAELERELRRDREKRSEALRKEMEERERERRAAAEEEWKAKAAQIEEEAAENLKKLKAAKRKEFEEDQDWLEKEMEKELDMAREEIDKAKDLRLARLKNETRKEIEREEAKAESLKREELERVQKGTDRIVEEARSGVLEEAKRESALVLEQVKREAESERFRVLEQIAKEAEQERAQILERVKAEANAKRNEVLEKAKREAELVRAEGLRRIAEGLESHAKEMQRSVNALARSPLIENEGQTSPEPAYASPGPIKAPPAVSLPGSAKAQLTYDVDSRYASDGSLPHTEQPAYAVEQGFAETIEAPGSLQASPERVMKALRKQKLTSPARLSKESCAESAETMEAPGGLRASLERHMRDSHNQKATQRDQTERGFADPGNGFAAPGNLQTSREQPMQNLRNHKGMLPGSLDQTEEAFAVPIIVKEAAKPANELLMEDLRHQTVTSPERVHRAGLKPISPSEDRLRAEDDVALRFKRLREATKELGTTSARESFGSETRMEGKGEESTAEGISPVSDLLKIHTCKLRANQTSEVGEGGSFSKVESTPQEEAETPRDDFEDMESLASTVTSARASVSDAGRRAWEELRMDAALQTPLRSSSLPVRAAESASASPLPSLTLPKKARAYLAQQRKFLKERQMIIEQARADWKKRLQELDQIREADARHNKRGFLMQLKATLEDAAHRVNEEARQMRSLKHELLTEAPPPPSSLTAIPVFRTFLPGRTSGVQRWSAPSESDRPQTADALRRQRLISWTAASGSPGEASKSTVRRASEKEPSFRSTREPLPGKLMSLLVRWNDERQIAGDLAQEHALWMDAFREKLRAAGAVLG